MKNQSTPVRARAETTISSFLFFWVCNSYEVIFFPFGMKWLKKWSDFDMKWLGTISRCLKEFILTWWTCFVNPILLHSIFSSKLMITCPNPILLHFSIVCISNFAPILSDLLQTLFRSEKGTPAYIIMPNNLYVACPWQIAKNFRAVWKMFLF